MASQELLLRAVQKATRRLASSDNQDDLLRDVLAICIEAVGASGGTIYWHEPSSQSLRFRHVLPEEVASIIQLTDMKDDQGVAGQVFHSRKTQINVFEDQPEDDDPRARVAKATGIRVQTMITVPLMMEDEQPVGVVQIVNKVNGTFNESDTMVLDTVAAVSTMASQNWRLLQESSRSSQLLGMGKVGHDIGNLAASLLSNILYSEMALDGLGTMLEELKAPEQISDYHENISSMNGELKRSVERIVGYSRLISDLSAGRELRPAMAPGALAETIETSASYLESDGRKNHVALRYDIEPNARPVVHDPLYVFRITQNLVGNAIKAVKETVPDEWADSVDEDGVFGEVVIRYRTEGSDHILEVKDSGQGMKQEVIDRILAGSVRSQWERGTGSGWGTKIVLELAATHQAKVEIDSEVGHGSTFRVRFPGT